MTTEVPDNVYDIFTGRRRTREHPSTSAAARCLAYFRTCRAHQLTPEKTMVTGYIAEGVDVREIWERAGR